MFWLDVSDRPPGALNKKPISSRQMDMSHTSYSFPGRGAWSSLTNTPDIQVSRDFSCRISPPPRLNQTVCTQTTYHGDIYLHISSELHFTDVY